MLHLLHIQFLSSQMKLDLKTTNDKIHKYTKLNAEHQESIREIEQQLKTKSDEIPLPVLEAEHEKIAASINKLRLRADEIRQRDASTVGLIENLSTGKIDVVQFASPAHSSRPRILPNCNGLATKLWRNSTSENACAWTWLMASWKAIRNRSKSWLKTRRLKQTKQRVSTSINTNEPSLIRCRSRELSRRQLDIWSQEMEQHRADQNNIKVISSVRWDHVILQSSPSTFLSCQFSASSARDV